MCVLHRFGMWCNEYIKAPGRVYKHLADLWSYIAQNPAFRASELLPAAGGDGVLIDVARTTADLVESRSVIVPRDALRTRILRVDGGEEACGCDIEGPQCGV